jgi:hypothetical protein
MEYQISVSVDQQYIILKVIGEFTGVELMELITDAHKLGEELGISNHLMDVTEARNMDSITKIYNFAKREIAKYPGINMKAKVAVLVHPEDHSHDFAETVTQNAGQDVTLFRDRNLAISHLLKSQNTLVKVNP